MKTTIEEKVAHTLVKVVSDFHLDLDMVGFYIARIAPTLIFNRVMVVLEAAQYEMEQVKQQRGKDSRSNGYIV